MARKARVDREQIDAVAQALAQFEGLEHITLASIATAVNVRVPSLYNHIGSLDEVKRAVVLASIAKLAYVLRVAATGRAGADAIRAMADVYRAFAQHHPGWYDAIQAARRYPDDEVLKAGDEMVEIVVAVLVAFHLQDEDALHAVRALRSLVHGFVSLELGNGFGYAIDRDESYRRLIGFSSMD